MTLRRVIVAAAVLCLLVVLACCGVGAGFFATDGSTMNAAFGSGCGHTGDLDPDPAAEFVTRRRDRSGWEVWG